MYVFLLSYLFMYVFLLSYFFMYVFLLIYPKDFTSIEIWLFIKSEGCSLEASMAEWLKRPTHNWRSRRFNSYWMHANRNISPKNYIFNHELLF